MTDAAAADRGVVASRCRVRRAEAAARGGLLGRGIGCFLETARGAPGEWASAQVAAANTSYLTAGSSSTVAATGQSRTAAADADAGYTPIRHAGVLLAVHTSPDQEAAVARALRDAGGMDVERAQGHWSQGSWIDFDPVTAPRLSDKVEQTV